MTKLEKKVIGVSLLIQLLVYFVRLLPWIPYQLQEGL